MTAHLVDPLVQCTYCMKEVEQKQFKSEFIAHLHYKTQDCPGCKKPIRVVVDFEGDGNDAWKGRKPFNGKKETGKIRTLEDKIQIVSK